MTLLDRAPGPPSWREWLLAAIAAVALLLALRPVHVSDPYWWDASAVYVPGAHWLETHHFAARPGVFPSDLSRGHTPLFYLVLAAAFRLFGTSPTVGHVLVLVFAASALTLTFALGRVLAGPVAGAAAMITVAVSPLFLTMSSEALPEIPCTALTMAVLYAFARGRYRQCAAWGCALVLTKELAVAAPAAVAGALLLHSLRRGTFREDLPAIATLSVPAVPLVGFFAWQRLAEGWFITPYHASLFNTPHSYLESFEHVVATLVAFNGRLALTGAALLAMLLPGPRRVVPEEKGAPARGTVYVALALLIAANVAFYTRGWFLDRYALPAHPAVALVAASAFVGFTSRAVARWSAATLALVVAITASVAWSERESGRDYGSGETTFRYVHAMRAQQAIFAAMEARGGDPAVLTTWPMSDELRYPYLGWVHRPFRVVNADYADPASPAPSVDAVVVFDAVGSARRLRDQARARGFR
ncbi:MAG: glycosyltransferase family 39 protein, partial [Deltaproteobacteria bacterium]